MAKNKLQWPPPGIGTSRYPPHAAKYLDARGVRKRAKRAGVLYVTADEAKSLVGRPKDGEPSDGLAIPNSRGKSGVVRFLRPGARPKFKQEKGSSNRFYEALLPTDCEHTWDHIRTDSKVPLLFVEGPIKALAMPKPAIGLNGTYGWMSDDEPLADFDRYTWKKRRVVLCYDSDIIQKPEVRQALARLGAHLKKLGARVRIRLLPAKPGEKVGPDDYVHKHGAAAFRKLPTYLLSDPQFFDWAAPLVVQELNATLAFVMHQGRATVLSVADDPEFPGTTKATLSRVSDVELLYANQFIETVNEKGVVGRSPKFPQWLQHPLRREVRRLTLAPGAPPGFDPATRDFNLWQGWGVVPHKPDAKHSWELLKRHIRDIVARGNKQHAEYILHSMARWVQQPARMPEVAIVLQGGEGAGKGILFKSVLKLFGRHGMHLFAQQQLLGRFNDHLKDKLFIFADEAFFAGDKQAIGALKGMVTEPTITIEPKFVNAFQLPNFRKIAMATNENWAVPADIDARRFAVFRVSDEHKGDHDYFNAIGNELANGGYEAMLYELQHLDIRGFDPRKIPSTEALFEQKRLSFDETTTWWFERLLLGRLDENETEWSDTLLHEDVQRAVGMRATTPYAKRALETTIGLQLRKLCPRIRSDRVTMQHGRRNLRYCFPPLDVCRRSFEIATQTNIDWQNGRPAVRKKRRKRAGIRGKPAIGRNR